MVDPRLIHDAQRGSRSARAELLRLMQDRWYRFAMSVLADPDGAQEAVQESALRVLGSIERFDGRSSFSTWSLGIVLNVCREMRRKRTSLRLTDEHPEPAYEPEPQLDRDDAVARVLAAMRELPDRQREAIILRFMEEQSVEETARLMKCAQGTVKATVHQALRSLKDKLKTVI